jgi:cell division protein FtsA
MVAGGLKVLGGARVSGPPVGTVLAALDIGSTQTSCIISVVTESKSDVSRRGLHILGTGTTASRGIVNGTIGHVEEAERCVRVAVDMAERNAKTRIHDVHVNVSGGRPQAICNSAFVKTQNGVVNQSDVDQSVAAALAKTAVDRRHILHMSAVAYSLDGLPSSEAPIGMHGDVLGVEVSVVLVDPMFFRNLSMVVARTHLQPASFTLSPLAAGRAVLLADEMSLGTIVIDMGGATTSFSVFRDGKFANADVVHVGGTHVTQDIAHGLSTTMAHAERLKTMFGTVVSYGHEDREQLAVPLLGERGVGSVHHIPKSTLTAIIVPRVEETFEMIRNKIAEIDGLNGISRIVLTGGASQLQGLRDMATHFFGCVVRYGQPAALPGITEAAMNASLSVPIGLLQMALKPEKQLAMPVEAHDIIARANMGYARKLGRWLKEAL